MQMALDDLQRQQFKIFLSVQQYRSQGYSPPELPDVDVDKIKSMLASREREGAPVAQETIQMSYGGISSKSLLSMRL